MITLQFLVTSLIVVLIPGTGVVFTVSTGLAQGRRASVYASLGCTAGIVPHLLASMLGLSAVMHTSALAFQALKFAGVAYLFYLAWATWRDRGAFTVDRDAAVRSMDAAAAAGAARYVMVSFSGSSDEVLVPEEVDPAELEGGPHEEWIIHGEHVPAQDIAGEHLRWYAQHPSVVAAGVRRHEHLIHRLGLSA